MPTGNSKLYSLVLLIADILVLLGVFSLAYIVRVQYDSRPLLTPVYATDYILTFLTFLPFWLIIFAALGLYNRHTYNRRLVEWSKIALGSFIGILVIIGWEYVSGEHFFPARLVAFYALIGSFSFLLVEREILRTARDILYKFNIGIRRVLIIGNSDATRDIAENLSHTARSGYQIVALAGPAKFVPVGLHAQHFTNVESALKSIKSLGINTIIQTDLYDSDERNQRILGAAQSHHIDYNFIPGEPEFYTGKNTVDVFLGYPMITVSQTPLIGWGAIAKEVFDRIVALTLIIILSC